MESAGANGQGDDGFNRPVVTPAPAPPDDQLVRLAAAGAVAGGVATLLLFRYLRRHLVVSWRR